MENHHFQWQFSIISAFSIENSQNNKLAFLIRTASRAHAGLPRRPPRHSSRRTLNAKFIIFNAKFIIFNAKFIVFDAKFIILNTKFTHLPRKRRADVSDKCALFPELVHVNESEALISALNVRLAAARGVAVRPERLVKP